MCQPLPKVSVRQTDRTAMDGRNLIDGKNLVTECFKKDRRSSVVCRSRQNLLHGRGFDRTDHVLMCNGRADGTQPGMMQINCLSGGPV